MQEEPSLSEVSSGLELDSNSSTFSLLPSNAKYEREFSSEADLRASTQWEAVHSGFNWSSMGQKTSQICGNKCIYFRCSKAHASAEPTLDTRSKSRLNCYRVTGCPARMQLREKTGPDGKKVWVCASSHTHHNHDTKDPYYSLNPLKIVFDEDTMMRLKSAIVDEGRNAADLRGHIRIQFPTLEDENIVKPHHYHGLVSHFYKEANGKNGQDELFRQALFKLNAVHQIAVDPENRIMSAYFALPISLNYASCSSGVYVVDCTYKVNLYDKPLLNLTSSDEMGNNFAVAFAVMHGESTRDYIWAFECFKLTLEQMNIPLPRIIMSGACPASLKACAKVFPNSAQMICHWHLGRDVIKNILPRVHDSNLRSGLLAQWVKTVESPTESEYDENLRSLHAAYGENCESSVRYLQDTWHSAHAKKFVKCFVNKLPHRGTYDSSRVESVNSYLKRSMGHRNYSLVVLLRHIERYIRTTTAQVRQLRSADRQLGRGGSRSIVPGAEEDQKVIEDLAREYSNGSVKLENLQFGLRWWMFDKVRMQVNTTILVELYGHFIKMYGTHISCTGFRRRTTGRPCYHTMLRCFRSRTPLKPSDFDRTLLNRNFDLESISIDRGTEAFPLRVCGMQSFPTMVKVSSVKELASAALVYKYSCVVDTVEKQEVVNRMGKQQRCRHRLEQGSKRKRTNETVEGGDTDNTDSLHPPDLLRRLTSDPTQHELSQDREVRHIIDSSVDGLDHALQLEREEGLDSDYDEDTEGISNTSLDASDPSADEVGSDQEALGSNPGSLELATVAATPVEEAPSSNSEDPASEEFTFEPHEARFFKTRNPAVLRCTNCFKAGHNIRGCPDAPRQS